MICKTKKEFMENVDSIIDISEKEPHVKKYITNLLRDIINSMAEKIYNE